AGAKLRLIIDSADAAAAMVNQIAAAAAEQTATTEEVNSNVSEIARISTETASESRQSAEACEDLGRLASNLSELVGRFQTGEDEGGLSASSQRMVQRARTARIQVNARVMAAQ
ncbi:MAG TPA: hypothetical protein VIM62_08835, partial [Acidobacteriaceae bacterium]